MARTNLILCLLLVALAAPAARADMLFVGSQAGLCCFDVDLHQVSTTEILLTATLTGGAQWFVDTGSGQHPGFAFNLSGDPAITISSISAPWTTSDVHLTSVSTGGPALGTFDYYIDNPGPGSSKKNAGPLSFDISVASGTLNFSDFVANTSGYVFVADIMDASGKTGLSGIAAPEPAPSIAALALLTLAFFRRRLPTGSK